MGLLISNFTQKCKRFLAAAFNSNFTGLDDKFQEQGCFFGLRCSKAASSLDVKIGGGGAYRKHLNSPLVSCHHANVRRSAEKEGLALTLILHPQTPHITLLGRGRSETLPARSSRRKQSSCGVFQTAERTQSPNSVLTICWDSKEGQGRRKGGGGVKRCISPESLRSHKQRAYDHSYVPTFCTVVTSNLLL